MKKLRFLPVFILLNFFTINAHTTSVIKTDSCFNECETLPGDAFITTWQTTTANESITISTQGQDGFNYNVDWGDGNISTAQTADATHSYATAGIQTISITGEFPKIAFINAQNLLTVEQWGTQVWEGMLNSFNGCSNLTTESSVDAPIFAANSSLYQAFRDCTSFNSDLSDWDVSNVIDMSGMFDSNLVFNQDISSWDVSGVTAMPYMFYNTQSFDQNLGGWDVSNVTDMYAIFVDVPLSTTNYDALLEGWNTRTLQPNIVFGGFNAKYCSQAAVDARANIISTYNWTIYDGGLALTPTIYAISDKSANISYTLPTITGSNLSGNEAYYTATGGTGTSYPAGTTLNYSDFATYPLTLYAYDSGCGSAEQIFDLTITNIPETPFITTWRTTAVNESITIPANHPYAVTNYNYTVDWGDGNISTAQTGNATHTYATAGTHTVSISGDFPGIYFYSNYTNAQKLLTVEQWGSQVWEGMYYAFYNCLNLTTESATDTPIFAANSDLQYMFAGCSAFNSDLNDWDMTNVTNMSAMFYYASAFNQNIGSWNVSNVIDMSYMFYGAALSATNYDALLMGWNSRSLQPNVSFNADNSKYCSQAAIDARANMISSYGWAISDGGLAQTPIIDAIIDVTANNSYTLPAITGSNLSGFEAYYTATGGTGTSYTAGTTLNYSDFATYPVTFYAYDSGCGSDEESFELTLTNIPETPFITTWQTTTANESITIQVYDVGFNYDVDWGDGNISTAQTASATHSYATPGIHTISISGDFPKITFINVHNLLTVEQWGTQVWEGMRNAFNGCSNLTTESAVDAPIFAANSSLYQAFRDCTSFNSDLSDWDVSNVIDMTGMFDSNLVFNQNINSWDVSNVTNMSAMFYNAQAFDQNLGSWDVSNVTDMSGMFTGVTLSTSNYDGLLVGWNTRTLQNNVTLHSGYVKYCSQATVDARANIISNYNWTIYDAGLELSPTIYSISDKSTNFSYTLPAISGSNLSGNEAYYTATGGTGTSYTAGTTLDYSDFATYPVTLYAYDNGCNSAEQPFELTITNIPEIPFITTWQTTTANESITIPVNPYIYTYNYSVDWGDGNTSTAQTGNATHTYATPGTHTVSITGDFPAIYFFYAASRDKILSIEQWGNQTWETMEYAFHYCTNLTTESATDAPVFSANISLNGMFIGCSSFNSDVSDWDVSNVTDMNSMFSSVTLSKTNYDALLVSWNAQNLHSGISFHGGNSKYCSPAATDARANMISSDNWTIYDGGATLSPTINAIADQTVNLRYLLPTITGSNLSGSEAYYTAAEGAGTSYNAGTIIDYSDFPNYPVTFYAFDNGCINAEQSFQLTITNNPEAPFITTWQITTANESITIPTNTDVTGYNYTVDWGDGNYSFAQTGDATHTYATAGTHTVSIDGDFPAINFINSYSVNQQKLLSIEQWGTQVWQTMNFAFYNCTNLTTESATDAPIFAVNTNLENMFRECSSFNSDLSDWDVSNVTSMESMFNKALVFNQDIGNWNVSNVTNMSNMFGQAFNFDQNIGNWDVSNVTDMSYMFFNITLSTANYDALLVGWDARTLQYGITFNGGNSKYCSQAAIDAHTNMIYNDNWTFYDGGPAITPTINPISNITVNNSYTLPAITGSNLSGNEAYYTATGGTGTSYTAGTILNYSDFATYPITFYAYDSGCNSAEQSFELTITDIPETPFITTWQTTTANESIIIPINNYNVSASYNYTVDWGDGNISTAQTGNATHTYATAGTHTVSISGDFPAIYFYNNSTNAQKLLTIEQWGSQVWETMYYAFYYCTNLTTESAVDAPIFAANTDLQFMFGGCSVFNSDLSDWDISNVTNLAYTFYQASNFNQNIGNWNVSNVADMSYMFYGATLSTTNYDAMLVGWNTRTLQPNISFNAGNSKYCSQAAIDARANVMSSYNWTIIDGGAAQTPIINAISDKSANISYSLPTITGTNLSGNEAYYTATGGTGTSYTAGTTLNYSDFATYPVTLYAYDSGCNSAEQSFELTITGVPVVNAPTTTYPLQLFTTDNGTLADLEVTGDNIQWYDAATGSNILANTTTLVDATTYYATQTLDGTESTERLAIEVNEICAPIQDLQPGATVADLIANPSSGTAQWFTNATGGAVLATTDELASSTYYVEEYAEAIETIGSGFINPFGIAIDAQGKIVVANYTNGPLKRMNPDGTNIETIGNSVNFSSPYNVAIDDQGRIIIADTGNNQIKRMNPDGTDLEILNGSFSSPFNVAVDDQGRILVADFGNAAIKRISANGQSTETLATGLAGPAGLALDVQGNILVGNINNNTVIRLDTNGTYIETLGSGFIQPYGLAVDSQDRILVSNYQSNGSVQRMNSDGSSIETIGTGFSFPGNIAIDEHGNVWVTDYNNSLIKRINANNTTNRVAVQVNLIDNEPPTVITQNITVQLDNTGTVTITPAQIDNGSTDNVTAVGNLIFSLDRTTFDCYDKGTVTGALPSGNIPSGLIGHWNFNTDNELTDLTGNWGDLVVSGNAAISNGKLNLDSGGMARTATYSGATITNKTLVAFMSLEDLDVRAGAPIAIDKINSDGFDAIVYAEQQTKRWMNGSSYFNRTQTLNPGYAETETNKDIMVAITYEAIVTNPGKVKITFYRNGVSYGSYTSNNLETWSAGDVEMLFGPRRFINSNNTQAGSIDASVDEAMIFNRALTASEIAQLGTMGNVTLTVTDENGNSASAVATVTVEDPLNFCCDAITEYTTSGWSNGTPTSNKKAIFINNYNTSLGNIDACAIVIETGVTVTVSEGTTIKAQNSIVVDGDLIFLSSPTGNGELAEMGPNSFVIGDANIHRFMSNNRSYRMISSAVTTSTSIHDNWQEGALNSTDNPAPGFGTHITGSQSGQNGFDATNTGNSSMFTVNVPAQQFVAIGNTDVNTLTAGEAYLLFVRGDRSIDLTNPTDNLSNSAVLRATGLLVTGTNTQSFPAANAGNAVMFGNPYQSAVDMNSVLSNSTNINSGHYHVYDPNMGDYGGYVTVFLPGGTNTSGSAANQFLQPGQGAQVNMLANGTSSVTFNESDKAPGNFTSTSRPLLANDMLTVQLFTTENFNNGGSVHDSFGIVFADGNNNSLTPADALKPMNFYENLGIDHDGTYLSIEQREMPQAGEEYPLYTSGYQHTEYTLKVIIDGLETNDFYLVDYFTGTRTLLETGENTYSFTVDADESLSIATNRFSIGSEQRLGVDDNNLLSGIRLYPNPLNGDTFYINAPKLDGEQLTVSISDLTGRNIIEQTLDCRGNTITVPMGENIASGVYMVTLKHGGDSNTYRLIKE